MSIIKKLSPILANRKLVLLAIAVLTAISLSAVGYGFYRQTDKSSSKIADGSNGSSTADVDKSIQPADTDETAEESADKAKKPKSTKSQPSKKPNNGNTSPPDSDDEQPASCVGSLHTPGGPDGMGGCWPGPHNTGVPAGTSLSNYTGTCSLRTDNQIINSKLINNCSGGLHVYASNVTIRNSKINGPINTNSGGSLTIVDSEVDGGSVHSQALGVNNLTALRVNVYGNQHAIHCNSNCDIRDSWMHDQYDGSSMGWHQNGYITNGGSNIILKHNTADCVGACTADIALLNDKDLANVTVDGNLLIGTTEVSYCFYGGGHNNKPGTNTNIVVKNNIFQRGSNGKCGQYGPVSIFNSKPGNVWSNNRWSDGTILED